MNYYLAILFFLLSIVLASNCPGNLVEIVSPSIKSGRNDVAIPVPLPAPNCQLNAFHPVMFQFTPDVTGYYQLDTAGSTYDTVLAVYPDCVSQNQMDFCNDDNPLASDSSSYLNIPLNAGTTYSRSSPTTNTMSAIIEVLTDASYPVKRTVSVVNKPAPITPHCQTSRSGAVYGFVAKTTGMVTFDTLLTDFDTVIAVFEDASSICNEIMCNDDFGGAPQSYATFKVTANTNYKLYIGGFREVAGTITFRISNDSVSILKDATNSTSWSLPNATVPNGYGVCYSYFGLLNPPKPLCECNRDYTGVDCNIYMTSNSAWIFVIVVILIPVTLCGCMYLRRYCNSRREAVQFEGIGDNTTANNNNNRGQNRQRVRYEGGGMQLNSI